MMLRDRGCDGLARTSSKSNSADIVAEDGCLVTRHASEAIGSTCNKQSGEI